MDCAAAAIAGSINTALGISREHPACITRFDVFIFLFVIIVIFM